MKLVKLGLRIYIAVSTVIGFLVGWILLAHSGKPAATIAAQSAGPDTPAIVQIATPAPLPPIPSLDDLVGGAQIQPLPAMPQIQVQPSIF
ncbi:MAG: hypothetical protein M1434_10335 [Chloroflexi bacterium]|nr:hypothetical protein [Chloroflexota bacterium]MCL5275124.1 hypothetical protein [Chloroflexota bacterium]